MPHSTNIPAAPSWSIEQSNGVTDLNIDVPFLMPKAPKTWKPGSIAYLKPPENSHGIHAVKRSFPESEDSGNMLCRFVVVLGYDKDDVIVAPLTTRSGKFLDGVSENRLKYYLVTRQVSDLDQNDAYAGPDLVILTPGKENLERSLLNMHAIHYVDKGLLHASWGLNKNQARLSREDFHRVLDTWNELVRPASLFTFDQYLYCTYPSCKDEAVHEEVPLRNLRPPKYVKSPEQAWVEAPVPVFACAVHALISAALDRFGGPMSGPATTIVATCAVRVTTGRYYINDFVIDEDAYARCMLNCCARFRGLFSEQLLPLFSAKIEEAEAMLPLQLEEIIPAIKEARRRLLPEFGMGSADGQALLQHFSVDELVASISQTSTSSSQSQNSQQQQQQHSRFRDI